MLTEAVLARSIQQEVRPHSTPWRAVWTPRRNESRDLVADIGGAAVERGVLEAALCGSAVCGRSP